MRTRIPLVVSVAALVVAALGWTALGESRSPRSSNPAGSEEVAHKLLRTAQGHEVVPAALLSRAGVGSFYDLDDNTVWRVGFNQLTFQTRRMALRATPGGDFDLLRATQDGIYLATAGVGVAFGQGFVAVSLVVPGSNLNTVQTTVASDTLLEASNTSLSGLVRLKAGERVLLKLSWGGCTICETNPGLMAQVRFAQLGLVWLGPSQ